MFTTLIPFNCSNFNTDDRNDHEDDDTTVAHDESVGANVDENGQPAPKPKKKRARRAVCTITKNKESLNAALETIPLPDPLFSKLNSIMGDVSSSNRLLLNILPTETSSLKLTLEQKHWDPADHPEVHFKDELEYEIPEEDLMDKPADWSITVRHQLRQHVRGYTVTNTPIDDDEEEQPPMQDNMFNQSQLDYAFDINAEVEVEPENDHFVMDYELDEGAAGEANELTEEDRDAIGHCKGLRRATQLIEELRPEDTTKNLEYSYRPLDQISQFWAGPSYWKFRKSRKLTINSNATTDSAGGAVATQTKRRQPRVKLNPVFVEDIPLDESDATVASAQTKDDTIYVQLKSKGGQKYHKSNLYKRFDGKKLKLPTDYRMDRNLFDTYEYAAGCFKVPTNTPVVPPPPLEYGENVEEHGFEAPVSRVQYLHAIDMRKLFTLLIKIYDYSACRRSSSCRCDR